MHIYHVHAIDIVALLPSDCVLWDDEITMQTSTKAGFYVHSVQVSVSNGKNFRIEHRIIGNLPSH